MFSIRQLGAVNRTYRHLNRYQRILRVLFKYGFSDLVDYLHIDQYLETGLQMINRKPREQLDRHSRPQRLRMALEELGPTFVKLGQLLSTRPDFIPPEYLDELAKLQDSVPPFSYEEVQQIYQEEFGSDPADIFEYFDSHPLAAASIGQVHQARLLHSQVSGGKQKNRNVVVKVQRPDIEKLIAVDLEILAHIARLMEEHLEEVQGHRPSAIVHEFARSLSREIDFTIELSNIQRFARQFENNTEIHVPEVYPSLSTERILVLEVFGRYAGFTAMLPTMAGAANRCVIPEYQFDIAHLAELLVEDRVQNPSNYSVVLVSEGATFQGMEEMMYKDGEKDAYGHAKLGGIGHAVSEQIKRESAQYNQGTPINIINQHLGYLVRGGDPDAIDSIVPMAYGNLALDLILKGIHGRLVVLRNGRYDNAPIDVVTSSKKVVDVKKHYNTDRLRPHFKSFEFQPLFIMSGT